MVNVTKPNQIPSCSGWLHDAKKVHAEALIAPVSFTKNRPELAAIVFITSREEVGAMHRDLAPFGLDRDIEEAGRHYAVPVLITASDVGVRRRLAREIHDHGCGTGRFVFVMLQNIEEWEIAPFQLRHATLFIDDVGAFDQRQQAALMRLLEYRAAVNPTRWRLIAASDSRLYDSTIHGRFRAELYYRLAVINIVIPEGVAPVGQ